jgi:nitronate monooxygenase
MNLNSRNTFLKHTNAEYPIICGAMYPCSNPELIAAASEGGGIAIVQPVSLTFVHGYDLREGIKYIRSLTNKPIGFNALIEKGSKKYLDRMSDWIDIALEENIRFFVTSLGKPDWVCKRVHQVGGFVYHDVTSRHFAKKGIDSGVDGLICVNNRAGGHLGSHSMEDMYKELNDLGLPLICAGGIGSEIELSKALKIGFDGVQMGTRFVASTECNTLEDYKKAIVNASEEDIVSTTRLTGVPVSVIKSEGFRKDNTWLFKKLLESRFKHKARMILNLSSLFRSKYYLKKNNGKNSKKIQSLYSAGKSVHTIHKIESATSIMQHLGQSINISNIYN